MPRGQASWRSGGITRSVGGDDDGGRDVDPAQPGRRVVPAERGDGLARPPTGWCCATRASAHSPMSVGSRSERLGAAGRRGAPPSATSTACAARACVSPCPRGRRARGASSGTGRWSRRAPARRPCRGAGARPAGRRSSPSSSRRRSASRARARRSARPRRPRSRAARSSLRDDPAAVPALVEAHDPEPLARAGAIAGNQVSSPVQPDGVQQHDRGRAGRGPASSVTPRRPAAAAARASRPSRDLDAGARARRSAASADVPADTASPGAHRC